ncbi:hypothetical protein [Amycolatopsis sp. RTGN1]|uniref:hypothetical protein n=1 Tax=Amycolatopsis ponsaeliensis TaxID=2992142 RepID=UPI00254BC5A0|nr:hypothetical protein [Amycolatopsis sp. RTGN1]
MTTITTTQPLDDSTYAAITKLEAEKVATEAALTTNAKTTKTDRPAPENMELLDALPYLAAHLLEARKTSYRPLFEITRLHGSGSRATISVHLPADWLAEVADAAGGLARTDDGRADCVRASDQARTTSARSAIPHDLWISTTVALWENAMGGCRFRLKTDPLVPGEPRPRERS